MFSSVIYGRSAKLKIYNENIFRKKKKKRQEGEMTGTTKRNVSIK